MKIRNSVLFSAALLLLLVSCGEAGNIPSETSGKETGDLTKEEETQGPYESGLTGDYEKKEFRIITHDVNWLYAKVDAEEESGDKINDAIFRRNRAAEDKLNFVVRENASKDDIDGVVKQSIQADEDVYDMAQITDRTALVFAQEGYVYPITELPHIDLTKPYWSQSLNSALSVSGQMYFAYGDFNLTPYDYSYAMVFNKKIAAACDIPDLYAMVREGKWTFDRFEEYTMIATRELDGDGKMDDNDQWGYSSQDRYVLPCFWISAGELSITKDKDDIPSFTLIGDEHFSDVIARIFDMTRENGIYTGTGPASFVSGHALFGHASFNNVATMRGSDTEFGIIPFPKWNEEQELYYSRVEGGEMQFALSTIKDPDFVGAVFEELNAQSGKITIPAYYEETLKTKAARDVESAEMLDIIFSNRVYDLGDTYWCNTLRDGIFNQMYTNDDRNLASSLKTVEPQIKKEIENTIKAFSELK